MKRARDPSDEEEEIEDEQPAPKSAARRAMDGNFLTNRLNSIALGIDANQHKVVIEEITQRQEYPAEGGYMRNRRTGEIVDDGPDHTDQAYAPNVFKEEAERRDIVANHRDVRFSTLVTGFTHNPLTKYVDTESIGHSVRAEAEYKRIREAQLKREASFASDKTTELASYLKHYEQATTMRQNALVHLVDPNEQALRDDGLADLFTILHSDGTPGFLFPFYMRWQYKLAQELIERALAFSLVLRDTDLAAVQLVAETDKDLAARRSFTPPLTEAHRLLMLCVTDFEKAAVPPANQVIYLALVFYHYIVVRDITENPLYTVGTRETNNGGQLTHCVLSALAKSIAAWPRIEGTEITDLHTKYGLADPGANLQKHYVTETRMIGSPMYSFWREHYTTTHHYQFFNMGQLAAPPHFDNRVDNAAPPDTTRITALFVTDLIKVEAKDANNRLFHFTSGRVGIGDGDQANPAVFLKDLRTALQLRPQVVMTQTLLWDTRLVPGTLGTGGTHVEAFRLNDVLELPNLARYDHACAILEQLVSPVLLAALNHALPDIVLRPGERNNYIYALPRGLRGATEKTYRTATPATINTNMILPRDALNFYAATEVLFHPDTTTRVNAAMNNGPVIENFSGIARFSKVEIGKVGGPPQTTTTKPSNPNGINGATLAEITAPLIFDGVFTEKLLRHLEKGSRRYAAVTADGRFVLPFDERDLDRDITATTTTKSVSAPVAGAGAAASAAPVEATTTTVKESSSTTWLDIADKLHVLPAPAATYLGKDALTHASARWKTTVAPRHFFDFLHAMTPLTSVPLALDAIAHTTRTAMSDANLHLDDWKALIKNTRAALLEHSSKKVLSAAELLRAANKDLYLPTHAYQSAPHISGVMYFTPFFTAVLAHGLEYARTQLGFRDATLPALTDTLGKPDLAIAFAAWIAAREAQSSITHPKQYMKDRAYGAVATIGMDANAAFTSALARHFRRHDVPGPLGSAGGRGGYGYGGPAYSSTYFPF